MPGLYEFKFLPEGRVSKFAGSRGNYYEFENGSHLDLKSTPVWCHRCGKITHGEDIDSLAEIDKQLADLHDPNSELFYLTTTGVFHELTGGVDEFLQDQIEELKMRKQWRKSRHSPAKCIACGSEEIFVFPMNQPFPDPASPGTVEMSLVGMCSTNFNEWFFTPEGDRIPRDTKPTYWHHPVLDKEPGKLKRLLRRLQRKSESTPSELDNDQD